MPGHHRHPAQPQRRQPSASHPALRGKTLHLELQKLKPTILGKTVVTRHHAATGTHCKAGQMGMRLITLLTTRTQRQGTPLRRHAGWLGNRLHRPLLHEANTFKFGNVVIQQLIGQKRVVRQTMPRQWRK